jgi:hypothetical protein
MKRIHTWEPALAGQFETARSQNFRWGVFDCALFVCDCAKAITRVDPGADYRGTYKTEAEAKALLGEGGLAAFATSVAERYGMQEWLNGTNPAPLFARRGDAVLIDNGDPGLALGIVDHGGRFAWCASSQGLKRAGMNVWLRAWRVG